MHNFHSGPRYALYGAQIFHREISVVLGCVPRPLGEPGQVLSDGGHGKGFADIATAFEIARRDYQNCMISRTLHLPWDVTELSRLPNDIQHLDIYRVDGQVVYLRSMANALALRDSLNAERDHKQGRAARFNLAGMVSHPRITTASYKFQTVLTITGLFESVTPRALGYRVGDIVEDVTTGLSMDIIAVLKDGGLRLLPHTPTGWSEDVMRWLSKAMTDPIYDGNIQARAAEFIAAGAKKAVKHG